MFWSTLKRWSSVSDVEICLNADCYLKFSNKTIDFYFLIYAMALLANMNQSWKKRGLYYIIIMKI